MSDEPSLLIWIINTAGFFGVLAFVAGVAVFFSSWLVVFRVDSPERIGRFRRVLFVPLLLALLGGVRPFIRDIEFIRENNSRLTSSEVVIILGEALWQPIPDALIVSAPAFLVLTIGKTIRKRRSDHRSASEDHPQAR